MYPKKHPFKKTHNTELSEAGTYSTILPQIKNIQKSPRKIISQKHEESFESKNVAKTSHPLKMGGQKSSLGIYHDGMIMHGESTSYQQSRKERDLMKQQHKPQNS